MAFTYTVDRFAVPIGARPSIKIGSIDLRSFGFELTSYPNFFLPSITERRITLDNRSGFIDMGSVYNERRFSISGQIRGRTLQDLNNKIDALKNFIDTSQFYQNEFIVNQESIRALPLEFSGNRIYYNEGTVTVTDTSATVTGSGTSFLSYVKPDVEFNVQDVSTRYFVEHVVSDTELTLSSAFSGTTASSQLYRVERRRYLLVNFSGESDMSAIADRGFTVESKVVSDITETNLASNIVNVTIGFYAKPFWIGDIFEHEETTVASNTFIELKGIGNTAFFPSIHITGAATAPSITTAKYAFLANFNGNLKSTDVDNSEIVGSYTVGTELYKSTNSGLGANVGTSDTLFFNGVRINPDQITMIIRFRPNVASASLGADKSLLNLFTSTSSNTDGWLVEFVDTNKLWRVEPTGSSSTDTSYLVSDTDAATFNADEEIELAFWYNDSGVKDEKDGTTYYAKLFVNGQIVGTSTAVGSPNPTQNLVDLIIGGDFLSSGPVTAQNQIDAIFDMVAIFNKSLSDEEIRKIFADNEPLLNTNQKIASLTTYAANDVLVLDKDMNASFYDSSENIYINEKTSITGNHLILRGDARERDIILAKTSSGTINKLKILYRPYFL